jgi:heparosan-N-sulfate-glucuronate 5-epimerase
MKNYTLLYIIFLSILLSCDKKTPISTKKENSERITENLVYPFPTTNSNIYKYEKLAKNSENIPLLPFKDSNELYPVTYTQAGLFYYHNYYVTKNTLSKEKFLNIANFIVSNLVEINDFGVLQYNFHVDDYKYELPATSSMSQGYALGIMIQAYSITQDEKYLKVADKILNSYHATLKEGGVLSNWDGDPFYEEYIDPKSHVLNGFIFSLTGLYYYYKTLGNEKAKEYFDIGINSLKNKISKYDATFTSYYSQVINKDKVNVFASAINEDPDHYHELVIYQLLLLYYWTNEEIFKEYAHKFIKQDTGFVTDFYDFPKYNSISATHTIDPINHGVNHLDNELWSWGNYWSTSKFPTDLIVEFDEYRNDVSAVSFYSINENSLPNKYEILAQNKNNQWVKVLSSDEIKKIDKKYYKTGSYETYIETHIFPKSFDAQKIKLRFHNSKKDYLITLREINFHFNREKEIQFILDRIKKEEPKEWWGN